MLIFFFEEEELWILTFRVFFSFALCLWFFSEEFSSYVAYGGHSFLTSTRNKEEEGAGGTKFWPILLMVVHSFLGRVFFLILVDVHMHDQQISFFL